MQGARGLDYHREGGGRVGETLRKNDRWAECPLGLGIREKKGQTGASCVSGTGEQLEVVFAGPGTEEELPLCGDIPHFTLDQLSKHAGKAYCVPGHRLPLLAGPQVSSVIFTACCTQQPPGPPRWGLWPRHLLVGP